MPRLDCDKATLYGLSYSPFSSMLPILSAQERAPPVGDRVDVFALEGMTHYIDDVCLRVNHWGGSDACTTHKKPIVRQA